ncbi:hypothetical protein LQZ18_15710 [Lachnospiraceae bacterium ZAX-1]
MGGRRSAQAGEALLARCKRLDGRQTICPSRRRAPAQDVSDWMGGRRSAQAGEGFLRKCMRHER